MNAMAFLGWTLLGIGGLAGLAAIVAVHDWLKGDPATGGLSKAAAIVAIVVGALALGAFAAIRPWARRG